VSRVLKVESTVVTGAAAGGASGTQFGTEVWSPSYGAAWVPKAWERGTDLLEVTVSVNSSSGGGASATGLADPAYASLTEYDGGGNELSDIVLANTPASPEPYVLTQSWSVGGTSAASNAYAMARVTRIIYPVAVGMIHT
jgi:hypothetical protein